MDLNIASRLLKIRNTIALSQRAMAEKAGLSPRAWQAFENGTNVPSGQTLIKLAELGFNTDWILTGRGTMSFDDTETPESAELASDTLSNPLKSVSNKALIVSAPELLAKINDTINRVYRDEGGRISPADMGRIAADKYAAILNTSDDPDERLVMVRLFETELRSQIRNRNEGNSKALA